MLSDARHNFRFMRLSVRRKKLGMVHQNHRVGAPAPEYLLQALRPCNRVDDHADAALAQRLFRRRKRLRFLNPLHAHHPAVPLRRNRAQPDALALCPAQQRISLACRNLRRRLSLSGIRFQQFLTPLSRQRGREQNHRNLIDTQPIQHPVQIGVHVGVIGVALVNDDHLSGQAQLPQHDMLLLQRRHEELVHRANHQVGQQPGLSSAEKRMNRQRAALFLRRQHAALFQRAEFLVELCLAMDQLHRHTDGVRLMGCPPGHARIHRVGRGLRRQEKRRAAQMKPVHQDLCRSQCGLCLSVPHGRFDDHNAGRWHRGRNLLRLLLDAVCRKPKALREKPRLPPCFGHLPGPRQVQLLKRLCSALRVIGAQRLVCRHQWKIGRIAGDPVRHDDKPRQNHLRRQRAVWQRLLHLCQRPADQGALRLAPWRIVCVDTAPAKRLRRIIAERIAVSPALRLSMVCADNRRQALAEAHLPQQLRTRRGMRDADLPRSALLRRVQPLRLQQLLQLRTLAGDPSLKNGRGFSNIVQQRRCNGHPIKQCAAQAQRLAVPRREPLGDQIGHHGRRIHQVNDQRQPETLIHRVSLGRQGPFAPGKEPHGLLRQLVRCPHLSVPPCASRVYKMADRRLSPIYKQNLLVVLYFVFTVILCLFIIATPCP